MPDDKLEILKVICEFNNATFQMLANSSIAIDGLGCNKKNNKSKKWCKLSIIGNAREWVANKKTTYQAMLLTEVSQMGFKQSIVL